MSSFVTTEIVPSLPTDTAVDMNRPVAGKERRGEFLCVAGSKQAG